MEHYKIWIVLCDSETMKFTRIEQEIDPSGYGIERCGITPEEDIEHSQRFMWLQGNYACCCNRGSVFGLELTCESERIVMLDASFLCDSDNIEDCNEGYPADLLQAVKDEYLKRNKEVDFVHYSKG